MKKVYEKPCIKVITLTPQSTLLQCSTCESTPSVYEVGMAGFGDPDKDQG